MSVEPGATPLPTQQQLAIERTRIAHERTLMAWIRTSMSMVSFGFTINELFGYLGQAAGRGATGPRTFGLGLIVLGAVALIAASYQHVVSLGRLGEPAPPVRRSPALLVALVMSVGSVALFVGVTLTPVAF